MIEFADEPTVNANVSSDADIQIQSAGVGQRLGAYLIDVLPITLALWHFTISFLGSMPRGNGTFSLQATLMHVCHF